MSGVIKPQKQASVQLCAGEDNKITLFMFLPEALSGSVVNH